MMSPNIQQVWLFCVKLKIEFYDIETWLIKNWNNLAIHCIHKNYRSSPKMCAIELIILHKRKNIDMIVYNMFNDQSTQ